MENLNDGFYTPFGIIFEIKEGTTYVYNHNGKRIRYHGGLNTKYDQAYAYLRKKPELVYKGTDASSNRNLAVTLKQLKNNAQLRAEELA